MAARSETTFGVFESRALSERISTRLLELIAERQLRPGDRLPPERELAATMQVSRPSLREALRALAIMGVVEIRQGSGTYVTSLRPEVLVEHLDFIFYLDDTTFLQLLEARRTIETGLARMAAERITDEELAGVEEAVERSGACVADHAAFLAADLELHQRIAAAARNPVLARFMASIANVGLAGRRRTVDLPGVAMRAVEDHCAILAALRARDGAAAAEAMGRHLDNVARPLAGMEAGM